MDKGFCSKLFHKKRKGGQGGLKRYACVSMSVSMSHIVDFIDRSHIVGRGPIEKIERVYLY